MTRSIACFTCAVATVLLFQPAAASAQVTEILVYDGGMAEPGVVNLSVHDNFTPAGLKTPSFEGGVTPDHSLNGVTEWAYGVTEWFEAGLFLPLYSHDKVLGWQEDGVKLRALFATPHADTRHFVYGANVEFSINATHWEESRFTAEVRPVVGWHLPHHVDVMLNPIVETNFDEATHLELLPATRLAYHHSPHWAVGVEEYGHLGRLRKIEPLHAQSHELFGVLDYAGTFDVEFGVGVGLTQASDHLELKLIVSKDLGHGRHPEHH